MLQRYPTCDHLLLARHAQRVPRPACDDVSAVLCLAGMSSPLPTTKEACEVGRGGGGRARAVHECPVCGLDFAVG